MINQAQALPELTDSDLVKRCLEQKAGAWEELLSRYRKRVFNIAYQFVGKFDVAEDLTQEIFFKVFKALHRFDPAGNFQQWLIRISKNHSIDYYRRRRKDRELLLEGSLHLELAQSTMRNPYRAMELSEKAFIFKNALSQLPSILKTCLTMRELEGMSYQEIAAKLEVPEGTVKSRINRARTEMSRIVDRMKRGKKDTAR